MKIKIKVEDLVKALEFVSPAVGHKSPVEACKFVKITSSSVTATNTRTELKAPLNPQEVTDSGEYLVDFGKLYSLSKAYDADAFMTLTLTETEAKVQCKRSSAKLKTLDVEFPVMKPLDNPYTLTVDSKAISEAVTKVSVAAPPRSKLDPSRPEMNGVYIHGNGQNVLVVATDGKRMHVSAIDSHNAGYDFKAIVPIDNTFIISKCITASEGDVDILSDGALISFEKDGFYVKSSLIDKNYLPYKRLIPDNLIHSISFNSDQFKSAVNKISSVTSGDLYSRSSIYIKAGAKEAVIRGWSSDQNSDANDCIPVSVELEEDFQLGFNPQYILDGVKLFGEDSVEMSIHKNPNGTRMIKFENNGTLAIAGEVRL